MIFVRHLVFIYFAICAFILLLVLTIWTDSFARSWGVLFTFKFNNVLLLENKSVVLCIFLNVVFKKFHFQGQFIECFHFQNKKDVLATLLCFVLSILTPKTRSILQNAAAPSLWRWPPASCCWKSPLSCERPSPACHDRALNHLWSVLEMKIKKQNPNADKKRCDIRSPFVCRIWTAAVCAWTRSSAAIATRGRSASPGSSMTKTDTIPSTAAATLWSQTPPVMIRRPRRLRVRPGISPDRTTQLITAPFLLLLIVDCRQSLPTPLLSSTGAKDSHRRLPPASDQRGPQFPREEGRLAVVDTQGGEPEEHQDVSAGLRVRERRRAAVTNTEQGHRYRHRYADETCHSWRDLLWYKEGKLKRHESMLRVVYYFCLFQCQVLLKRDVTCLHSD